MSALITRLESMLDAGQDNLLLRFGLGKAYAEQEDFTQAVQHLEQAVLFDPLHSSSWFWLGRSYLSLGQKDLAEQKLNQAIQVATEKGDQQTIKMAQVFLRRLRKS